MLYDIHPLSDDWQAVVREKRRAFEDFECGCMYCRINRERAQQGLHPHDTFFGVLRSIVKERERKGLEREVEHMIDEISFELMEMSANLN